MDNLDKRLNNMKTILSPILSRVFYKSKTKELRKVMNEVARVVGNNIQELFTKDDIYRRAVTVVEKELDKIGNPTPEDIKEFVRRVEYNIKDFSKEKNPPFVLVLSVAINKISKDKDETISLEFKEPYDYLFFGASEIEVEINIAGDYLGCCAERVKIIAKEAGHEAGAHMKNSVLMVDYALNRIGYQSIDSIILGKNVSDFAGEHSKNLTMILGEAGNSLAAYSTGAWIIVNTARNSAGLGMKYGGLNIYKVFGNYLGAHAENSMISVKEVDGKYIGAYAKGTTIEIYRIKEVSEDSIHDTFFEDPNNMLFVGEETYEDLLKYEKYRKHKDQIDILSPDRIESLDLTLETSLKKLYSIEKL